MVGYMWLAQVIEGLGFRMHFFYEITFMPKEITVEKFKIINIIWADISERDILNLREQINLCLSDPNYTIVTNYEIHWKKIKLYEEEVPKIVWAPNATIEDIHYLKEQLDKAFEDSSFPIICGFEVNVPEIETIEKVIPPTVKSQGLNRFQILKQKI
jgi:hypothetical protein